MENLNYTQTENSPSPPAPSESSVEESLARADSVIAVPSTEDEKVEYNASRRSSAVDVLSDTESSQAADDRKVTIHSY